MTEALIATAFLIVSAAIGMMLKPTEDQLRPLTPQASSGNDDHGHGHDAHH
jgi:hypothetical protein